MFSFTVPISKNLCIFSSLSIFAASLLIEFLRFFVKIFLIAGKHNAIARRTELISFKSFELKPSHKLKL